MYVWAGEGGAGERGMESIIVYRYLAGSTMYPTMYGT